MGKPKPINEQVRQYTFPGGNVVTIEDVIELSISSTGNHRLRTEDGRLHLVPKGWLHIEIMTESKQWSF